MYTKTRFFIIALALIMLLALAACGDSKTHEGEAKTPSGSSIQNGRNYLDVITNFEKKGFINIKTEVIDDLITGWMTKDGEVESVSVDGNADYSPDRWYPNDVEVIITYHTFPIKGTTGTDDPTSAVAAAPLSTPTSESTPAPTVESISDDTILTAENSVEFAAILVAENPGEQIVKDFVEKYKGRTIEFDGYVWDWINHSSTSPITGKETVYKTLYDTCVWVGDVENADTVTGGPTFRVEEVSFPNFSAALNRRNVHITARILYFDENLEFVYLRLISIDDR